MKAHKAKQPALQTLSTNGSFNCVERTPFQKHKDFLDKRKRMRRARATEMEKFLRGQKWDWFITITSRHHLTDASARRVAENFHRSIKLGAHCSFSGFSENHIIDITKGNDGLSMWVCEPHKHASSGYHLHLLLRFPYRYKDLTNKEQFRFLLDKARRAVGGNEWLNANGKMGLWHRCKLEPYKGERASEYCAKYLTKDLCDYDFNRIL